MAGNSMSFSFRYSFGLFLIPLSAFHCSSGLAFLIFDTQGNGSGRGHNKMNKSRWRRNCNAREGPQHKRIRMAGKILTMF